MNGQRVEEMIAVLRGRGERITPARRALIEELAGSTNHLTAEDLTDRICGAGGRAHRATVYRSLEVLERAGLVEHVHLGHGRAVYHLADDIHQHLVCESCGAVIQAPEDLMAKVAGQLHRSYGFEMRPYHFAVLGRCRDCALTAPIR